MNSAAIDLMIIGVQKAGTTSLFRYLQQHPEVRGQRQREITYFFNDHEFRRGYDDAFQRYFDCSNKGEKVLVAKHAMAVYSKETLRRIHSHNPNVRLVVMLRNPIRRAYSAYWYARRRGWETVDDFQGALDVEQERLRQDGWHHWRNCAYQYNGLYDQHLRQAWELFDPSKVRVYLTEDLRQDSAGICQDMFRWLGIDSNFTPLLGTEHNVSAMARSESMARVLAGVLSSQHPIKRAVRRMLPDSISYRLRYGLLKANEEAFTPPPMARETRERLAEAFMPHNARLADLLDRDLDHWID